MNNRRSRTLNGANLLVAAGLLCLSTQVLADDVEIFVSTDDQEIGCPAPNVLFIIDTSGSMDTEIETQAPWDPNVTYSGCFNSSRIYYSESGIAPYCGFGTTVAKADIRCDAMGSSTEYTGLFQTWDPALNTWTKIPDSAEERLVECAADEGIHGDGTSGEVYAVDGDDGPWSDEESDRIAWGANATAATLFDGNWLNWQQQPPVPMDPPTTRMDIVKDVVNTTLDNMDRVNVGLMEFNRRDGGPVSFAIGDLNATRSAIKQKVAALEPGGSTPLSETLYEAGQYLAGRSVDFGNDDPFNLSVPESRVGNSPSGSQYQSPLAGNGQNNYIVLLTDGEPSNDTDANGKIQSLPDYADLVGESCNNLGDGACLDKMAQYLFMADLRDDLPGQQNVITHTIGFATDFDLLENTAARGGGKYFVADNTATLTQALADLAKDFARAASLLVAPTVPVNNFNRAERINEVYLSLFQPEATHHWPGNLKKYKFINTASGAVLVGADNKVALIPEGEFIDPAAISLWSAPLVDGDAVQLGGAASQLLDPGARNLQTNAAGDTALTQINIGNSAITAAMLGAPAAERDAIIQWARGIDVRDADEDGDTTDARLAMGDPLHVQPVVGEYGDSEASRNAVVFIATNDGYLHAVNADTGNEIWAFVPHRLLDRLYALSLAEAAQAKQYGLDGMLVLINNESTGKPDTLLFGMRRGGEALFSMNVSSRTSPQLNWIIDSTDPEFLDMGQTWSPPVVSKINVGGQVRTVAIFGGGYDPGQDNRTYRTDTKGNAIYFVDVATGDIVWSAGSSTTARSAHDLTLPRMNFSIPAGIRVIDRNQDGLADRMYVGDMGGQVWRFDIIPGNNASTLVQGGVLASLGAAELGNTPPEEQIRRFYNTPDIVNVIEDENIFTAINIGSGYRAHPLDIDVDDEFFSIRDFHSTEVIPTADYATQDLPLIVRDDLINITGNGEATLEPSDAGWRLGMVQDAGEKILGESLTIDNVLFFNSFAPTDTVQSCLPGAGLNRSYRVSILDGSALTNLDDSADAENLTPTDRFVEGSIGAPIADPSLGPDDQICSGLDCFDGEDEFSDGEDGDEPPRRARGTYWYPVEAP